MIVNKRQRHPLKTFCERDENEYEENDGNVVFIHLHELLLLDCKPNLILP